MSDKERKGNQPFRQDLTPEDSQDLSSYLAQLGEGAGAAAAPDEEKEEEPQATPEPPPPPPPQVASETPAPSETPEKSTPLSRYDEIRQKRGVSMEKEDLALFSEFSVVIGKIHAAQRTIEKLREAHPDLVAERIYNTWISNLKDTHMIMMREFHSLRNGLKEKKYDKRCICVKCNTVFLVPLPADGICDECRSSKRQAASQ